MKKIGALVLAMAMVIPTAVACGGTKDEAGVLNISAFQGGYGVDWLDELGNKFQKKTGIKVNIEKYKGQKGTSAIYEDINSKVSVVDLIVSKDMWFKEIYQGKINAKGQEYDNLLEDLTSLYNSKVEGEDVTLLDKMDANFSDYYNIEGKYYAVPWASGMIGLLRNKNVWKEEWQVPRTTDEMFALADTIKASATADGYEAPFIYSEDYEYWSMFSHVWIAQYKGSEGMKSFYNGYNADGDQYEATIFEDDGFRSTLGILEKLLKNENKYMHPTSKSVDFSNMQGSFLSGRAVMTPNGDWIEREMKSNYKDVNIEFIKTPLNSAVANKCSFKAAENKDELLAQLVSYVDENKEGYANKPEGTLDTDVDIVRDARNIEYTVGNEHFMAIPSYSNAKEEAKKFILFMASDEGIKTYIEQTNGCVLPYEYDASGFEMSDFRKATSKLINESNLMFASKKDRLFSLGGVDMYWFNDTSKERVVPSLSATSAKDYRNADQIMSDNNAYLNKHWDNILKKANLI